MKLLTADNLLSFENLSAAAYKIGIALIDWGGSSIMKKDLIAKANLKESSFKRAINQLISFGFIERKEQIREKNGDFGAAVYVCQKPAAEPDKIEQVNKKLMVAHLKEPKSTLDHSLNSGVKILEIFGLDTFDFIKALEEKKFTADEKTALINFVNFRRSLMRGHPELTEGTLKSIIMFAYRLKLKNHNIVDCVNQSILKKWRGLFPIHKQKTGDSKAKFEKQDNNAAAIEAPTIVTPPDSSDEFAEAMRKQREFYAARGINLEASK